MRAQFTFHPARCTGCGACVMACINEKGTDIDRQQPYRLLGKNEYAENGEFREIVWFTYGCMHCKDSPCMAVCPKRCISSDRETGTVQMNSAACVGCHRCERACPFGAIQFIGRRATKCDGCINRLAADQPPLCVLACPRQALTVTEKNRVVSDGLDALRAELGQFFSRK